MTSFRSWIRRGVSTSSPPRVLADPNRAPALVGGESPRVNGFHHCRWAGVDVYSRCAPTDDDDDDDDDEDEPEPDNVTHEPSGEDRPTIPTHPGGADRRGQRPRNKLLANIDAAAIAKSWGYRR
jgi:hypothetical protein